MSSQNRFFYGIVVFIQLITVIRALQLPFGLSFGSPSDQKQQLERVHYSELPEHELPIKLQQYQGGMVIRVSYGEDKKLRDDLILSKDVNIWSKSFTSKTIDIQVDETQLSKLLAVHDNLDYKVIIDDLAQKVFESYPENHINNINTAENSQYKYKATEEVVKETEANVFSEIFFREYRPLETIESWLKIIQQTFPDVVKIEEVGKTFEGRPYNMVHLSQHSDDDHSDKKTIVIGGGIHAREWISVSTVCYQLYSLLNLYVSDPSILDELDFIFVPIANPDGYEYSWTNDRLWRKNRQNTILPRCFGLDIDHSFNFHWTKSNDWPCGEEYSGEDPLEAVEAKIWYEYLKKTNYNHKVYGYIDLHSYSEEILYPFAFSCSSEPRDEENLIELAYGISKAIRLKGGKNYNVLPACQDKDSDLLPDLGSGTALDYMYHHRAYWAYQLKLRDTGNHGFLLPSRYIEPVGEEIFAGIKYFIDFITQEY